jgi:hypothetical protein
VVCWFMGGIAAAQQPPTPAHGYLYIEPYQARFECLVSLEEMLAILGEPKSSMLPATDQAKLRLKIERHVEKWLAVKVDGKPATAKLLSAALVKGVPGRTQPIGPDDLVVVSDTMAGMVWEIPFAEVPEKIEPEWRGFEETLTNLPVSVVVGAQSLEASLQPEAATKPGGSAQHVELSLTKAFPSRPWESHGNANLRRGADIVPVVPTDETIPIPMGSIIWLIIGWWVFSKGQKRGRKIPGRVFTTWLSLALGAAVLWRVGVIDVSVPSPQTRIQDAKQAERILTPLLRNTYRAFDQREESAIYDALARSIDGELLQKVYLQTVAALTLDEKEGTRVTVTEVGVDLDGVALVKAGAGFVATGGWTAVGSVGHWGHNHPRINGYKARITVQPVQGVWKITGLEILEERRA